MVNYIQSITFKNERLEVHLLDGRVISVPLSWYPRLASASAKERNNWELIGNGVGIHWEDIDEDLSLEGLFQGIPSPEWSREKSLQAREIYTIRTALGFNQQKFARLLGVRQASLSDWEKGKRTPSPLAKERILKMSFCLSH